MTLRVLFFTLFWMAFSGQVLAQEAETDTLAVNYQSRNSVYAELGGNALLGSLNYERLIPVSRSGDAIILRAGLLGFPNGGYQDSYYAYSLSEIVFFIPLEIIFPLPGALHFDKQRWRSEWALGGTLLGSSEIIKYKNSGETFVGVDAGFIPTLRVGWRYQPAGKAYFFKASITGFVIAVIDDLRNVPPIIPWPSAGFGYSFGKKKN